MNLLTTGCRTAATGPTRLLRLAIGGLALAVLAVALSQTGQLPGLVGELLRANVAADRDATALFYTEVKGWSDWPSRAKR